VERDRGGTFAAAEAAAAAAAGGAAADDMIITMLLFMWVHVVGACVMCSEIIL